MTENRDGKHYILFSMATQKTLVNIIKTLKAGGVASQIMKHNLQVIIGTAKRVAITKNS
jgi:hypothetical protein